MKKYEILKTGRPNPRPQAPPGGPKILVRPNSTPTDDPIPADPTPRTMREAVRFITDIGDIVDSVSDIMSTCPNFNVVSAIGPQGSGKSTILSMLAGNNSRQMYREYVFRPVSREANEQSRHQTVLIDVYVTNHQIFLDCQPMNSFSIMEMGGKARSGKFDEKSAQSDTLRLTAFLLFVSHTVLVVSETHFDKNIIDTMRCAELIRPYLPQFRPKLSMTRKTNLIFIKSKSSSIDTSRVVNREREELLRLAFQDSKWLKVSAEPDKVLIPIEEIRMRKENLYEGHDQEEQERDERQLNEFDEAISRLREELWKNREEFTVEVAALDEKKWVEMCREVIRDKTFHMALKMYRTETTFFDLCKSTLD